MATLTKYEERERRRQELIEMVRAMSVDGVCPSLDVMGIRTYKQIQWYFGSITSFCEEAGLRPRRRPQKRKKPREFKKGRLREVLGAWDEIDEYERRLG